MAFKAANFGVLAHSGKFTQFHYSHDDDKDDYRAPGFFNKVGDRMRPGDMLIVTISEPGPANRAFTVGPKDEHGNVRIAPAGQEPVGAQQVSERKEQREKLQHPAFNETANKENVGNEQK